MIALRPGQTIHIVNGHLISEQQYAHYRESEGWRRGRIALIQEIRQAAIKVGKNDIAFLHSLNNILSKGGS